MNFSFIDATVPTKKCVCSNCKIEGFMQSDFPIIVTKISEQTKQPIEVLILCKSCFKVEAWTYEEYLKAVNLKPIGV